ncbi:1873_t:CDS:2, partial [Scutellospora calospora]
MSGGDKFLHICYTSYHYYEYKGLFKCKQRNKESPEKRDKLNKEDKIPICDLCKLKHFRCKGKKYDIKDIGTKKEKIQYIRQKYIVSSNYKDTKLSWVINTPKVIRDVALMDLFKNIKSNHVLKRHFYICIPTNIEKFEVTNEDIVSFDPGVRTLLTEYDPKRNILEFGNNDIEKIKTRCKRYDKLQSFLKLDKRLLSQDCKIYLQELSDYVVAKIRNPRY